MGRASLRACRADRALPPSPLSGGRAALHQIGDAGVGSRPVSAARALTRTLARPLRAYLDSRFDRLEERLDRLAGTDDTSSTPAGYPLDLVDVSEHNRTTVTPFDGKTSVVVAASHYSDARLRRWLDDVFPEVGSQMHRKVWEHCYVLEAAAEGGVLAAGSRAIGFGVGQEPLPAVLARYGLEVLATDREPADSEPWAASGQHLSGLSALSRPAIVGDDVLREAVSVRYIDMAKVPSDLGEFDLVWSSGSLEHLETADAGLEFVLRTLDLVAPGGVSVHTTELELAPHTETRNYGHLAVYRVEDLNGLVSRIRERNFEISCDWRVILDSPADRHVSVPPHDPHEPVHLKLAVGDSVLTSVGIVARRPT
jgi:hypothetical protein